MLRAFLRLLVTNIACVYSPTSAFNFCLDKLFSSICYQFSCSHAFIARFLSAKQRCCMMFIRSWWLSDSLSWWRRITASVNGVIAGFGIGLTPVRGRDHYTNSVIWIRLPMDHIILWANGRLCCSTVGETAVDIHPKETQWTIKFTESVHWFIITHSILDFVG